MVLELTHKKPLELFSLKRTFIPLFFIWDYLGSLGLSSCQEMHLPTSTIIISSE